VRGHSGETAKSYFGAFDSEEEEEEQDSREELDKSDIPPGFSFRAKKIAPVPAAAVAKDEDALKLLFTAAVEFVDALRQAFATKAADVTPSTNSLVMDTLKELEDAWIGLGDRTNDLYTQLLRVATSSDPFTPDVDARLQAALLKVSEVTPTKKAADTEIQRRHQALEQLKKSTETLTVKVQKVRVEKEKHARNSEQYEKHVESNKKRMEENKELEHKLTQMKKAKAELEQRMTANRTKFDKEIVALRQQIEDLRAEKRAVDVLKSEVETARADRDKAQAVLSERQEKMKSLEAQKVEAEKRLAEAKAEAAKKIEAAMGGGGGGIEAESQSRTVVAPVAAATPALAAATEEQYEPCAVCQSRKNPTILFLNCMENGLHFMCDRCFLTALDQSVRNHTDFKYTVCPVCHESVIEFEGENLSGKVEWVNGRPQVLFTHNNYLRQPSQQRRQ